METKSKTLEELAEGRTLTNVAQVFIKHSKNDEATVKNLCDFLNDKGLSRENIASKVEILTMKPDVVRNNYSFLESKGIKGNKGIVIRLLCSNDYTLKIKYMELEKMGIDAGNIADNAQLLCLNTDSIKQKYRELRKLGLSHEDIKSNARLLARDLERTRDHLNKLKKLGITHRNIFGHKLLRTAPEMLEGSYSALKEIGVSDAKIASRAESLEVNPEIIKRNYALLREYGVSKIEIPKNITLLERNPKSLEENYAGLKKIGFNRKGIAGCPDLLAYNPSFIKRKYEALKKIGLDHDKIVKNGSLLCSKIETLKKNYQNAIGILRQDYKDRNSGRALINNFPQLLVLKKDNLLSNVQYLGYLGLDYNKGILLGSNAHLKREKMALMLREFYGYSNLNEENKKLAINSLYQFISENPKILYVSKEKILKDKEMIKKKIDSSLEGKIFLQSI